MIWWIVFTVLGCYMAWFTFEDCYSNVGRVLHYLWSFPTFGAIGFLLGVILSLLIALPFNFIIPAHEVTVKETPIYSLVDNAEYSGRFVLGTGKADSDICIYYVAETENGKQIEKVNRENAVIKESAESPRAVTAGKRFKYGWMEIFFIDIHEILGDTTTLTVPVGTVTTEYTVDLK